MMTSRLAILALAAGLAGCASLSPIAAVRLAAFDPLAADPAGIAVAVKTSERLHVGVGNVILRLALEADDPALAFDETFRLAVSGVSAGSAFPDRIEKGEHVRIATVKEADRARLAGAQAKARAARETGNKGKGTLSVSVTGGCRTGPIDGQRTRLGTYMRTEREGAFFALTRGTRLAEAIGADKVAVIPECESAG